MAGPPQTYELGAVSPAPRRLFPSSWGTAVHPSADGPAADPNQPGRNRIASFFGRAKHPSDQVIPLPDRAASAAPPNAEASGPRADKPWYKRHHVPILFLLGVAVIAIVLGVAINFGVRKSMADAKKRVKVPNDYGVSDGTAE